MNTAVTVEKNMTKYPVIADPSMTSREALKLMKTFHIRHLPVVEEDSIVGIVSQRDLVRSADDKIVGDSMMKNPYVVRPGTPLSEVTCKMATEKYGSTVIVNQAGDVLGIFTTTDALKMLTWYLAKEERENGEARDRRVEEWFDWDTSVGE